MSESPCSLSLARMALGLARKASEPCASIAGVYTKAVLLGFRSCDDRLLDATLDAACGI
ncbi:hypothetical protein G3480_21305 [Thiorhodococcus mannitoliphagus]|uniref:Uncharacterized protein n=1 Tax=Thiorhodococcus mannitoliphagus TaxID=329406 RepID=A0A6P1DXA2_9GAMM|nr:hypothetical protein [Thiorhodococcus mannitoliphagus]NEX22808.1 hypothetical protein [Thiorhodococcus mannitoliphagus]